MKKWRAPAELSDAACCRHSTAICCRAPHPASTMGTHPGAGGHLLSPAPPPHAHAHRLPGAGPARRKQLSLAMGAMQEPTHAASSAPGSHRTRAEKSIRAGAGLEALLPTGLGDISRPSGSAFAGGNAFSAAGRFGDASVSVLADSRALAPVTRPKNPASCRQGQPQRGNLTRTAPARKPGFHHGALSRKAP